MPGQRSTREARWCGAGQQLKYKRRTGNGKGLRAEERSTAGSGQRESAHSGPRRANHRIIQVAQGEFQMEPPHARDKCTATMTPSQQAIFSEPASRCRRRSLAELKLKKAQGLRWKPMCSAISLWCGRGVESKVVSKHEFGVHETAIGARPNFIVKCACIVCFNIRA